MRKRRLKGKADLQGSAQVSTLSFTSDLLEEIIDLHVENLEVVTLTRRSDYTVNITVDNVDLDSAVGMMMRGLVQLVVDQVLGVEYEIEEEEGVEDDDGGAS